MISPTHKFCWKCRFKGFGNKTFNGRVPFPTVTPDNMYESLPDNVPILELKYFETQLFQVIAIIPLIEEIMVVRYFSKL